VSQQFELAFFAGLLSVLSPCVLPLLPVVLGAAATESRLGPIALAGGLAFSFAAIGIFVASVGFGLGLNGDLFRDLSAILMLLFGAGMVSSYLGARIAAASGFVGQFVDSKLGSAARAGIGGQFGVGVVLGGAWSPCVGPTLGAASLLASQGKDLVAVASTMIVFGVGAATPLVLLGMASREILLAMRGRLLQAGQIGKTLLGVAFILVGLSILTDWDRQVEAYLVDASPAWLTSLTTRY
jgi:cytochrome c-type biogenesis protein